MSGYMISTLIELIIMFPFLKLETVVCHEKFMYTSADII